MAGLPKNPPATKINRALQHRPWEATQELYHKSEMRAGDTFQHAKKT